MFQHIKLFPQFGGIISLGCVSSYAIFSTGMVDFFKNYYEVFQHIGSFPQFGGIDQILLRCVSTRVQRKGIFLVGTIRGDARLEMAGVGVIQGI